MLEGSSAIEATNDSLSDIVNRLPLEKQRRFWSELKETITHLHVLKLYPHEQSLSLLAAKHMAACLDILSDAHEENPQYAFTQLYDFAGIQPTIESDHQNIDIPALQKDLQNGLALRYVELPSTGEPSDDFHDHLFQAVTHARNAEILKTEAMQQVHNRKAGEHLLLAFQWINRISHVYKIDANIQNIIDAIGLNVSAYASHQESFSSASSRTETILNRLKENEILLDADYSFACSAETADMSSESDIFLQKIRMFFQSCRNIIQNIMKGLWKRKDNG